MRLPSGVRNSDISTSNSAELQALKWEQQFAELDGRVTDCASNVHLYPVGSSSAEYWLARCKIYYRKLTDHMKRRPRFPRTYVGMDDEG